MSRSKSRSPDQLRDKAVKVLFDSLNGNHTISLEECYKIYDKMQKINRSDSDKVPGDLP
jgi:hypothetical protein